MLLISFPNVPSGHVPTHVSVDRNSYPEFPHLVHSFASVVVQATHVELQSPHISPTGSFPSLQVSTQALFWRNIAGITDNQELHDEGFDPEQVVQG